MVSDSVLALANCDRGEDALSGDVLGVPATFLSHLLDKVAQSEPLRPFLLLYLSQLLRCLCSGEALDRP